MLAIYNPTKGDVNFKLILLGALTTLDVNRERANALWSLNLSPAPRPLIGVQVFDRCQHFHENHEIIDEDVFTFPHF